MKIIKSNGEETQFSKSNIINAISKANMRVRVDERFTQEEIKEIAKQVEARCKAEIHILSSADIQNMVEDAIIAANKPNVVKAYITYRYQKAQDQKKNTIDDRILSLIDGNNEELKQENSNKNPTVINVQRDYMAGEVSKDMTQRYLMPEDIYKAHKEGIIHFHDMDYFLNKIHNCFLGTTRFYTDKGVKSFDMFEDGDSVNVIDKDGVFRTATVHHYGVGEMNKITFKTLDGYAKQLICTANHRWLLEDGSVTTDIRVGDRLLELPAKKEYDVYNTSGVEKFSFCLGYLLALGRDRRNSTLCSLRGEHDAKYRSLFLECGFNVDEDAIEDDGVLVCYPSSALVEDFINDKTWRCMTPECKAACIRGYYIAQQHNRVGPDTIGTPDKRVCDFIEETAHCAGYYITSSMETSGLWIYKFIQDSDNGNKQYVVSDIEKYNPGHEYDMWCVEEPVTHSFMLENGMITGNCDLINLKDMFDNGTVLVNTKIDRPHRFSVACTIASQIAQQVSSSQYGGQTMYVSHLSPFVEESRKSIRKRFIEDLGMADDEQLDEYVEKATILDVEDGIQTLMYQLNSLQGTNGQAPFITLFMYLDDVPFGRERDDLALVCQKILEQRILGLKNSHGVYVTTAFPKLIYVLDEDNITKDSQYHWLTKLSAVCTAKRMVPDYISAKKMRELKGDVYACMGCRSFLTPGYVEKNDPWKMTKKKNAKIVSDPIVYNSSKEFVYNDKPYNAKLLYEEFVDADNKRKYTFDTPIEVEFGHIVSVHKDNNDWYITLSETRDYKVHTNAKYTGRFNQGVVTINLPDVALSSKKDIDKFWYIMEDRLELCHRALRLRHERLRGVESDIAPILWQNGVLARLQPGETIDKLLYNGYSTISLGYVGLYECVKYMTGKDHWLSEDEGGALEFAKEVMQKLNDKCKQWKEIEHIDYSVYGTPEESTTQKFAQCLQRRFGIIEGITDKNYVTNSYHIPVFVPINAFDKISNEAPLQALSPGGAISYIEGPCLANNIDTVLELMKHFYENLVYGEINLCLDHCNACGFDGELNIEVFDGRPEFVCPQCGEREFNHTPSKLHFARRVCGYISTHTMCDGRKFDVKDRVKHI